MLVMSIHSYRGGTGKTLLATNLAATYARKEKVLLLDYDLRAPSLHSLFDQELPDWWINTARTGSLIHLSQNLPLWAWDLVWQ